MPKHLHVENSIHDFDEHEVKTETFTETTNISLYNTTEKSAAQLIGVLNNGQDYTKVIIYVGNFGSNIGADVTQFEIKGTLINADYTVSVASNIATLTITGSSSVNYTFKYYAITNSLI